VPNEFDLLMERPLQEILWCQYPIMTHATADGQAWRVHPGVPLRAAIAEVVMIDEMRPNQVLGKEEAEGACLLSSPEVHLSRRRNRGVRDQGNRPAILDRLSRLHQHK
jgi:hypothetical protein